MESRVARSRQRRGKLLKKTLNACQLCRTRKIKCTGSQPCQSCLSKSTRCIFEEREKRVVISEDYVIGLRKRILALESGERRSASPADNVHTLAREEPLNTQPSTPQNQQKSTSAAPAFLNCSSQRINITPSRDLSDQLLVNPLTASKSQLLIGDNGYFRYLGHSSTWSFSRQMRNLLHISGAGSPQLHDTTIKGDGVLYDISWNSRRVDLSRVELPSRDIAEYYANTVSVHFGSLYHLHDNNVFMKKLREFYAEQEVGVQKPTGLWHIQMLLVFACGKSMLAREAQSTGPAGTSFFKLAIEGLPDIRTLQQEPILAIEVLCLLVLFLEAADIRSAAYGYIGQAVTLALLQGMNREFESGILALAESEHRSRLWWTIYTIDRRLTASMGVPLLLHDADITLPLPPLPPHADSTTAFALHVRLSAELGQVLSVVYGLQGRLGGRYVEGIQSILQNLSRISTELNSASDPDSRRTKEKIDRTTASLHLLYHQCSILAIRPVLFSLLESKLARNKNPNLSEAVIALLRVCVESAIKSLKIIGALKSETQLDLFLPSDMDIVFSAAFALVLVDMITPSTEEQWDIRDAFLILDYMIGRGINPATVYKEHLEELNEFRAMLRKRECPSSCDELPQEHAPARISPSPAGGIGGDSGEMLYNLDAEQDAIWTWMPMDNDELAMLHPDTMQSAISGLNPGSIPIEFETNNQWMWESYHLGD